MLLFSGCATMSDAEKEKAENYEREACADIMRYVWEEYHTLGIVRNRHVLTLKDTSYMFAIEYATPYVEAEVKTFGKDFRVIYNVETGECYDNYYAEEMQDALQKYVCSELDIEEPEYIECWFNPSVIETYYGVKGSGFWKSGMTFSAEDFFAEGEYEISILIENATLTNLPEEEALEDFLCQSEDGTERRITFVDYRKESVCGDSSLTAKKCTYTDFTDATLYAYANQVYSAVTIDEYDAEIEGSVYANELEVTARNFKRTMYNEMIFAWDASRCNIQVDAYEPRAIMDDETGECAYQPLSKVGVAVTVEKIGYDDGENKIYCFYEEPRRGESYVAVVSGAGRDTYVFNDREIDGYCYRSIPTENMRTTINIGLYQKID